MPAHGFFVVGSISWAEQSWPTTASWAVEVIDAMSTTPARPSPMLNSLISSPLSNICGVYPSLSCLSYITALAEGVQDNVIVKRSIQQIIAWTRIIDITTRLRFKSTKSIIIRLHSSLSSIHIAFSYPQIMTVLVP